MTAALALVGVVLGTLSAAHALDAALSWPGNAAGGAEVPMIVVTTYTSLLAACLIGSRCGSVLRLIIASGNLAMATQMANPPEGGAQSVGVALALVVASLAAIDCVAGHAVRPASP